jgi:hypothetical protein
VVFHHVVEWVVVRVVFVQLMPLNWLDFLVLLWAILPYRGV